MSLCEASDSEDKSKALGFAATIKKARPGGRIGAERKKSTPERRRMRAVGGGKMEPVEYKPRKDIGKPKGSQTQAPEQERGSARERQLAAAKEERRKAALARRAAKSGGETSSEKPKSKDLEKQASKLLSKKKPKAAPAPGYTPQKASGLSTKERLQVTRKGEKMLRGIMKDQETAKYREATGESPKGKAKTKILGHVEKRMAN